LRVKSLDSLRGVAALIVVFHHCILLCFSHTVPAWIKFSPLRILNSGDGSVQVFFALSGFVLFLSLRFGEHRFLYFPYIVKRVTRLYPPFCTAIFASAIMYELARPQAIPALGHWFNYYSWNVRPTLDVIAGHLAMTDRIRLQGLDNVMWSLAYEVRISLVFPLLAWCVGKNWRFAAIVALIVAVASRYIDARVAFDWLYDPFGTLAYIFLFTGGAALALNANRVQRWLDSIPRGARGLLWFGALFIITLPIDVGLGTVVNFAAILLVALCLADSTARVILSYRFPRWLGRISYSLYLVHLPILLTLVHLLFNRVPLQYILLLTIVLSLAVADIAYRLIEKPCIDLGRRVASLLASPVSSTLLGVGESEIVVTGK
jgi:peptidoglycan/LPS O-acetylase OafA/YrhL